MKLFGSRLHFDILNINNHDLIQEIQKIKNLNSNLIQCFVKANKQKYIYNDFKNELIKNNIKLVVHASYTINIAKDWDKYSSHLIQFIKEINIAEHLGAFGIVLHIGKQLKLTTQCALNNMYSSMIYVYNQIKNLKIKIFFETSTGQGSEMCFDLKELAVFFNKFIKSNNLQNKFRICLDTCHIYQAGYDITDINKITQYLKDFDNLIGLRYIALVHLNDSKNKLGQKIDRHESLGKGYIGHIALKFIADYFLKNNVPIILETPAEYVKEEIREYF
jgi:deoxyribonuclease-4